MNLSVEPAQSDEGSSETCVWKCVRGIAAKDFCRAFFHQFVPVALDFHRHFGIAKLAQNSVNEFAVDPHVLFVGLSLGRPDDQLDEAFNNGCSRHARLKSL